jgi:anti-sigma regulatory factor (Ser/Thr protein kinase)
VTGDVPRYEVDAPEPEVVVDVRQWVAGHVEDWGLGGIRDDALLVSSELVTNSLRHARTAFVISLRSAPGLLRVEVFDRDTRLPVQMGADEEATSGRGLLIVAAVADQWGSRTEEHGGIHGKVVWAELRVRGGCG